MIEKIEQFEDRIEYRILCDKCSFYQDFEAFDFNDLLQSMRFSGWLIKYENDEWQHICFECNEAKEEDGK